MIYFFMNVEQLNLILLLYNITTSVFNIKKCKHLFLFYTKYIQNIYEIYKKYTQNIKELSKKYTQNI